MFYITKGRGTTPLNTIWTGEFCMGVKCIDVSNKCYTMYECELDAQDYLERVKRELNEWIEKDIPEQAKNWGEHKQEFLDRNQKRYEDIKKVIDNMKIRERVL